MCTHLGQNRIKYAGKVAMIFRMSNVAWDQPKHIKEITAFFLILAWPSIWSINNKNSPTSPAAKHFSVLLSSVRAQGEIPAEEKEQRGADASSFICKGLSKEMMRGWYHCKSTLDCLWKVTVTVESSWIKKTSLLSSGRAGMRNYSTGWLVFLEHTLVD